LDTKDIAIWCLLGNKYYEPPYASNRRPEPKDVARRLGIDTRTVTRRIRAMERNGFIRYYQLIPNYNLLGLKATAMICYFENVSAKYRCIQKVGELLEGVLEIHNPVGPSFMLWVAYDDHSQKARRLAVLRELTGSQPRELYDREFPNVSIAISNLDWRIMWSLRNDAAKPISTIARELGVTRKTVRRRLERMVVNKAFMLRAVFDPSRVTGIQLCQLCVYLDGANPGAEKVLREFDSAFRENIFLRMVPLRGRGVMYGLYSVKVGEPEDFLLRALAIKGVSDVELRILKEVREYPELIDSRIKAKLA
jgi:DNA-binding Lrp family transcriptional regulator